MMKKNLIFLVYSVFLVVYGVRIDGWWHYTFGRNEFWIAPHFMIASGVGLCMFFGWSSLRLLPDTGGREKNALKLFTLLILGIFVVGVAWDQLWHEFIGLETLDSVWLTLGPAHVLQKIFFLVAIGAVFPVVTKHVGNFWGIVLIACSYIMAWESLVLPLKSFGGMRMLGPYGELFMVFILVAAYILSKRLLTKDAHDGSALMIACIALAMIYVGISSRVAPNLHIIRLPPVPNWLVGLSMIISAGCIDYYWEKFKNSPFLLGSLAGMSYGLVLAPLAKIFLSQFGFVFSWLYVVEVLFSSILGGGLAAMVGSLCTEERLSKLSDTTSIRKIVVISAYFIFSMSILFFLLQTAGVFSYSNSLN